MEAGVWVSVREALPEIDEHVLCAIGGWDEPLVGTYEYLGPKHHSFPYPDDEGPSRGLGFSFSGGDWDADFGGPRFGNTAKFYGSHYDPDTEPDQFVTHWMRIPELP